jgi:LuxR family maltose regulon positive regulatory protein
LINSLEDLISPVYLFLDDYQFISNSVIHAGLTFFLDHIPANVHLVMASRSDPPIPMARLRARGQMTELRADDLRFNYDEINKLFTKVMGFELTAEDMVYLAERTEGWIAGLQMAALALKSIPQTIPSSATQFIKNFAGSHRYILDFLVEEVLSNQPQEIQNFLLQTSILENLSGSLCDTVIASHSNGLEDEARSSQHILEYLERSNLFLVSLDSDRNWYRYHHLFSDLLRVRLEQHAPHTVSNLHLRASEWFEKNQRLPEAINHALDARDYDRACQLIELLVGERMFAQNGIGLLLGWIRRLPPEIVSSRPWLCIVQATSAMFINDVEKIEPLLRTAELAIKRQDRQELYNHWKGQIANLRAFVFDVKNNVPGTIEMVHQALEFLDPEDPATRTYAKYLLGRAYFICGDFTQAIQTLTENVRDCMQANGTNIIAPSLSALSKIYRIQGRLRDSIELLNEGRAFIERYNPQRVTVAGLAYVGLANAQREWNNLVEAEEIIRKSLALCEPWVNPSSTCGCYTVLARILLNQGHLSAAGHALHLAEESLHGRTPLADVISDVNVVRVGLWLASHQIPMASQWVQNWEKSVDPGQPFSIPREQDEITRTHVQIAEGKHEIALHSLEHLASATETGGRIGFLIEIRILQALAFQALHDHGQAHDMLQKSLALAEPEGYLRIYVNEGQPMRELLQMYVHAGRGEQISYAYKLLAAFNVPITSVPVESPLSNLVESLTAREIEILQAMGEGLSNHQIAEKFVLAEGTVKFYVHAVLEKLGVHNRTQAVLEAKKIKII